MFDHDYYMMYEYRFNIALYNAQTFIDDELI